MRKNDYEEKLRSCFENARNAQQTYQFPLALRLYRRCIRLGEKWQDRLPGYIAKGFLAVARLRYAETLIYCGSISRGAALGLRTVRGLGNAVASMKLPKATLATVRQEMRRGQEIFEAHRRELHCPTWILEPKLFEAVLHIVSKHDPVGIARDHSGAWTEYALEVEDSLPRLKIVSSVAEVEKTIRQIFRFRFGKVSRKPWTSTSYKRTRLGTFVRDRTHLRDDFPSIAEEIWRCIHRPEHKRALADIVDVQTPIANAVKKVRKLRPKHDEKLRLALIEALKVEVRTLDMGEKLMRALSGESPEAEKP